MRDNWLLPDRIHTINRFNLINDKRIQKDINKELRTKILKFVINTFIDGEDISEILKDLSIHH
jgi:hypothetical protein